MSDYEQLQNTVSILTAFEIVFFVIAGICLIIGIILFFKYKIPNIVLEISGKKKQKRLAEMTTNKQANDNRSVEIKYESSKESNSKQKKRSDTIQKDDVQISKRHETTLSQNKRQTTVMDKNRSVNESRKQHNTVIMEKKKAVDKKYDTLDEMVLIHSDEIIE